MSVTIERIAEYVFFTYVKNVGCNGIIFACQAPMLLPTYKSQIRFFIRLLLKVSANQQHTKNMRVEKF